ncbi:MAG: hypothetical protein Q7R65_01215 [bacterium]|nr:hypothetical protein [bacterium]
MENIPPKNSRTEQEIDELFAKDVAQLQENPERTYDRAIYIRDLISETTSTEQADRLATQFMKLPGVDNVVILGILDDAPVSESFAENLLNDIYKKDRTLVLSYIESNLPQRHNLSATFIDSLINDNNEHYALAKRGASPEATEKVIKSLIGQGCSLEAEDLAKQNSRELSTQERNALVEKVLNRPSDYSSNQIIHSCILAGRQLTDKNIERICRFKLSQMGSFLDEIVKIAHFDKRTVPVALEILRENLERVSYDPKKVERLKDISLKLSAIAN